MAHLYHQELLVFREIYDSLRQDEEYFDNRVIISGPDYSIPK